MRTVIGDVHGKIIDYERIIHSHVKTICVGDFGFKSHWDWHIKNVDSDSHRIVMGNHDYTPYVYRKPSLGDFGVFEDFFVVRGAYSIDRAFRTEGLDWFSDEELSYEYALRCFDLYEKAKPEIVLSHDCPHSIRHTLFGITDKSDTSNLLEAMFQCHKPKIWIFGHHHKSKNINIKNTNFICLAELETLNL